jgi:hypothetical protein
MRRTAGYWLLENASTGKPFSALKALYLRVVNNANWLGVSPNGLFTKNLMPLIMGAYLTAVGRDYAPLLFTKVDQ